MDEEEKKKRRCAFESLREKFRKVKTTNDEEDVMKEKLPQFYTFFKSSPIREEGPEVENTQKIEQLKERSSIIRILTEEYLERRVALEQIKFSETSIMIPPSLLSPNQIHSRFQPKKRSSSLCFLKSQIYNDLKGKLEVIRSKDRNSPGDVSLLYGEAGIGKSFGMALNVLEKRGSWRECPYLIFYLHNQDENSYMNVFQEFLYSLCFVEMTEQQEDDISEALLAFFKVDQRKSLEEQANRIRQASQFQDLEKVAFRELLRIMNLLDRHILLVIDQAPINTQQKMKPLWEIILNLVSQNISGCTILLISSQLPPQMYAWDEIFQKNIQTLSGKFSSEEVELYLKNYISSKFWNPDSQKFSQSIERIKSVSEKIPYELSKLCDLSFEETNNSEDEVIKHYYRARKNELEKSHWKISRKLRNDPWIEYLAYTFLGIRFRIKPTDENYIDQNLCGFDLKEEEHYQLKFHCELYSEWILEYEMPAISKFIESEGPDQIQKLSRAGLKGTTKGDILEKCCILHLCNLACNAICNIWTFTYYDSDLIEKNLSTSFRIVNYLIFRVRPQTIGDSLLEYLQNPGDEGQCQANTYSGTLFIPNGENFQGLDVIFMCATQKTIFLMQYALNIMTHKSLDVDLYADLNDQTKAISDTSCYGNLLKGLRILKNQGFVIRFIWYGLLDGTHGSNRKLAKNADKQEITSQMKGKHKESWFVLLDEQKSFQRLTSICGS